MKLSNTKLISTLSCVLNNTEDLPEGVSLTQFRNFSAVYDGEKTKPAYMVTFINLAKSLNCDISAITAGLMDLQDDEKPLTAGAIAPPPIEKMQGTRFIFTSAQNNTDVHSKFLKSLLNYAKRNNAQLVVGKFVYNKNGFQNGVLDGVADNIYYAKGLEAHFNCEQLEIAKGLVWCGDLNILPTAKNPLTGFETLTGISSSIVPHAKIALESVATPKAERVKMMYATGAVTMHNYIQKKAGQIAQHAHCYGALVVEIDEQGEWFARQIQTDDSGIFQDLSTLYYPDGSAEFEVRPAAINWGDIHAEKSDNDVLKNCQDISNDLYPINQLFHDTFDMTARNHHNRNSGHFLAQMHYAGAESVKNDLIKAADTLSIFDAVGISSHVVESNHDLALESWLNDSHYDFRTDPINAITYLQLQSAIYNDLEKLGEMPNVLQLALDKYGKTDLNEFSFMGVDDSLIIAGVECGMHGHIGCNGSRGNPNQFQKLNRPINTGHTHSASIKGSVYTAGVTGSLDMGYNKGASSWSHSHIVTYANGFRTIITQKEVDGGYKYKA